MIVFSGLDGAGKSTQINLLTDAYAKTGITSIIFWSRGGYSPGMMLLKSLFIKKKKIEECDDASIINQKKFSNTIIRKTWLFLSILDLIYFYGVYVRLKELFGVKVICDRYIFDTSIDFKLNFPQEKVDKWLIWKFLKIIALKPKKHFVITISIEESTKRSKLKNEPFPDSIDVLKKRLNQYIKFISYNLSAIHIDGSKSIDSINKIILEEINK